MKKVEGFLTDDKTFFDDEHDAEFYEARRTLELYLADLGIRAQAVFDLIDKLEFDIERYIRAKRLLSFNQSVHETAEGDDVSLLEQPSRGHQPMSSVGDDLRTEEVRVHQSIDGTGGGRDDASDLRSSEDMAVGAQAGTAETRRSSSDEDIREETMEEMPAKRSRRRT